MGRGTRRARPARWLHLLSLLVAALGGAAAGENLLVRCDSEDDLDGSSCRVDMLPDSALAEMVYERGFDVEGLDRYQLIDAVMQLLDYEEVTGENLREMEYIPDDGSAAAAAETAAVELEVAAANAAAAALAADAEAAALAATGGSEMAVRGGGGRREEDEGTRKEAIGVERDSFREDFEEGGAADDRRGADDGGDQLAHEVIEESSSSSSSPPPSTCTVDAGVDGDAGDARADGDGDGSVVAAGLVNECSLLGYAHDLAAEVLAHMRRDMNSLVGLLPAPVAKPIRDGAAFVGDAATRFVAPALRQAERYTRGLRRAAGKSVDRAGVALRDEVLPRAARAAKAAVLRAMRPVREAVRDAIEARRAKREGGGEGEGEGGDEEASTPKQQEAGP